MKYFAILSLCFLIFGCKKPDEVKPAKRQSLKLFVSSDSPSVITYTDSNMIYQTANTIGNEWQYQGGFFPGNITIIAKSKGLVGISILSINGYSVNGLAYKKGTGNQTLTYTLH